MLKKLLKYEIKATARTFLPIYLVLILFGVINCFSVSPGEFGVPAAITMSLYVFILIGTFVTTLIVMIQRFYKNLLNDEGYLMFTLPAQIWQHIVSKLLVSLLWTVLSTFFAILSILIISMREFSLSSFVQAISLLYEEIYSVLGSGVNILAIQVPICIAIFLIANILMIYVSISIGHLLNRHRIMASIGAYFGIYTILQITLPTLIIKLYGDDLFVVKTAPSEVLAFVQSLFWLGIITGTILSAIFFFITNYILSRRLNLE